MAEAFTPRLGGGETLGESPLRALGRIGTQLGERLRFGGDEPTPPVVPVGDAGLIRIDQRAMQGDTSGWIGFNRDGEPKTR